MIPALNTAVFSKQDISTSQTKNIDKRPSGLASRALQALDFNGAARYGHSDILKKNIGWKIDAAMWAAGSKASRVLAAQSETIADALERNGIQSRLQSNITCIGAVTGIVEAVPLYRAIRFIPSVAARDRRPVLNGLRFLMLHHPRARYFRYAVFTSPEPVVCGSELRDAIQKLSRRISKWAKKAREHDVDVLFRGIEFTRSTAAERDAAAHDRGQESDLAERYGPDAVLYHVHANVITWPKRAMKDEDWSAFLSMTWKAVKAHWKDNGSVKKADEIVKYCLKPADLESATDDELVWLYRQTERLKLVQPLGPFAEFMAGLEKAGEKIVRIKSTESGKLVKVRKSRRLGGHKDKNECNDAFTAAEEAFQTDDERGDVKKGEENRPQPKNMLLGISLPQWRHTPWAEPVFLIQNYDSEASSSAARQRLHDLDIERHAIRLHWDANEAPAPEDALRIAEEALSAEGEAPRYKVHTRRPTVPEPSEANGSDGRPAPKSNCVPPASSVFHPPHAPNDRLKKLLTFDAYDDIIPFDVPALPFLQHMREHCASVSV
ncbi:hypothetical protein [Brucella pseudogrignonensis]|uniref:hypothetical protein n=1 Tax=Brucella pseudogrignonensis TaxID=419475 RepID=UPI0038D17EF6